MICHRFWGRISTNNRSVNDSKSDQKQDASWDGFWMSRGSIFGGFWDQAGGQVGAKLAPRSEEMGYQDDVKKSSEIWRREGTRVNLVQAPKESLWDPLILEYKSTRGKLWPLGTHPSRARGPGADIQNKCCTNTNIWRKRLLKKTDRTSTTL